MNSSDAAAVTAPTAVMDLRDQQLARHMRQRRRIAAALPLERQCQWARRCLALAAAQQRTVFYLMASLWLSQLQQGTTCLANGD